MHGVSCDCRASLSAGLRGWGPLAWQLLWSWGRQDVLGRWCDFYSCTFKPSPGSQLCKDSEARKGAFRLFVCLFC